MPFSQWWHAGAVVYGRICLATKFIRIKQTSETKIGNLLEILSEGRISVLWQNHQTMLQIDNVDSKSISTMVATATNAEKQ